MPRQPSLWADIRSAIASSVSYPPCPDLCRCRIYTLQHPHPFRLVLVVLSDYGTVAGGALFGWLFTSSAPCAALFLLASLGVAGWLRLVVWNAKWEPAHRLDSDATHTWHGDRARPPSIGLGVADSPVQRTVVKVPTTLGLLATDVLRASAQVGAALFVAFWIPHLLPLWGWIGLIAIPGWWCFLLWQHWKQCAVLS